jgi:hypothetical protein
MKGTAVEERVAASLAVWITTLYSAYCNSNIIDTRNDGNVGHLDHTQQRHTLTILELHILQNLLHRCIEQTDNPPT